MGASLLGLPVFPIVVKGDIDYRNPIAQAPIDLKQKRPTFIMCLERAEGNWGDADIRRESPHLSGAVNSRSMVGKRFDSPTESV